MARTVDHISGGRLVLGIGAGWFQRDYDEYGYEFGTAGYPARRDLADDLARIEARWSQLNPAPTRRIPVLVGGGGEKKTLRLTARHADIWHGFGDAGRHRRASTAVLDEWCDSEEREPVGHRALRRRRGRAPRTPMTAVRLGTRLFTVEHRRTRLRPDHHPALGCLAGPGQRRRLRHPRPPVGRPSADAPPRLGSRGERRGRQHHPAAHGHRARPARCHGGPVRGHVGAGRRGARRGAGRGPRPPHAGGPARHLRAGRGRRRPAGGPGHRGRDRSSAWPATPSRARTRAPGGGPAGCT